MPITSTQTVLPADEIIKQKTDLLYRLSEERWQAINNSGNFHLTRDGREKDLGHQFCALAVLVDKLVQADDVTHEFILDIERQYKEMRFSSAGAKEFIIHFFDKSKSVSHILEPFRALQNSNQVHSLFYRLEGDNETRHMMWKLCAENEALFGKWYSYLGFVDQKTLLTEVIQVLVEKSSWRKSPLDIIHGFVSWPAFRACLQHVYRFMSMKKLEHTIADCYELTQGALARLANVNKWSSQKSDQWCSLIHLIICWDLESITAYEYLHPISNLEWAVAKRQKKSHNLDAGAHHLMRVVNNPRKLSLFFYQLNRLSHNKQVEVLHHLQNNFSYNQVSLLDKLLKNKEENVGTLFALVVRMPMEVRRFFYLDMTFGLIEKIKQQKEEEQIAGVLAALKLCENMEMAQALFTALKKALPDLLIRLRKDASFIEGLKNVLSEVRNQALSYLFKAHSVQIYEVTVYSENNHSLMLCLCGEAYSQLLLQDLTLVTFYQAQVAYADLLENQINHQELLAVCSKINVVEFFKIIKAIYFKLREELVNFLYPVMARKYVEEHEFRSHFDTIDHYYLRISFTESFLRLQHEPTRRTFFQGKVAFSQEQFVSWCGCETLLLHLNNPKLPCDDLSRVNIATNFLMNIPLLDANKLLAIWQRTPEFVINLLEKIPGSHRKYFLWGFKNLLPKDMKMGHLLYFPHLYALIPLVDRDLFKEDLEVYRGYHGRVSLLWAAHGGDQELAYKLIVDIEIHPDIRGEDGRTALIWAARHGHRNIALELIVAAKATINLINNGNRRLMKPLKTKNSPQ